MLRVRDPVLVQTPSRSDFKTTANTTEEKKNVNDSEGSRYQPDNITIRKYVQR